jgi:hypothetical protein
MACPAFTFFSAALPGEGALRYWTRLRGTFNHIDAAIEASDPSVSRDEFRRQMVRIVDMICAAEREEDGLKKEGFCEILDCAMEESLVSLQSVPADAVPRVMESCPDIADAIAALQSHGSERVRGLARDVIRGWKASVEDDIAVMSAAVAALDALLETPPSQSRADGRSGGIREDKSLCPKKAAHLVVGVAARANKTTGVSSGPTKTAPAAAISRATMTAKQAPRVEPAKREVSAPLPKKGAPVAGRANATNINKTKTPAVVGNGKTACVEPAKSREISSPLPKKSAPVIRTAASIDMSSKPPLKTPAAARSDCAFMDKMMAAKQAPRVEQAKREVSAPLPKKGAPVAGRANATSINKTKTPAVVGNGKAACVEPAKKREISAPLPKKSAPFVDARRANTGASIDKSSNPPLKTPAAARTGRGDCALIDKMMMESAKRKLREGYEETADAKRQRRIQVIDAPKMPEQRRREMTHPVLTEPTRGSRGGASNSNTAVGRSSMMHARQRTCGL